MDPEKHKKYTGVDNKVILQNLVELSDIGANIVIRLPLIIGINDDDRNISETADFLSTLAGEKKRVELLPYHNIADNKHRKLGREFVPNGMAPPGKERIGEIIAMFASYGITAQIN